jgi:hypothetical protein
MINGKRLHCPSKDGEAYTVILLSYKSQSSKTIENYCKKLEKCAKDNELKFIKYLTKIVILYDPNIAINPKFWDNLIDYEKEDFYYFAHFLRT